MKIDYPKSWFERHMEDEINAEIGAGSPRVFGKGSQVSLQDAGLQISFGTFVNLWRRSRGWDAARLANETGIATEEIFRIEHDSPSHPDFETISKLARVFGLPVNPLLESAKETEHPASELKEQAVRYSSGSHPLEALTDQELAVLNAFVRGILEASDK